MLRKVRGKIYGIRPGLLYQVNCLVSGRLGSFTVIRPIGFTILDPALRPSPQTFRFSAPPAYPAHPDTAGTAPAGTEYLATERSAMIPNVGYLVY